MQSAVFHNNIEYLKVLLNNGHEISFVDSEGKNLLHIAAQYSGLEMNEFLIQKGVNINQETKSNSWTPLNYACRYPRKKIVKLYLENGANFQALSHNPINNALTGASKESLDVIEILADKGINLNDSSSDPIHRAISYDMVEAVKLMIGKGADYTRRSDNSWNYLHWSAFYGSTSCVKYLKRFDELFVLTNTTDTIETRIGNNDTTIIYLKGISASDIARISKNEEVFEILNKN